MYKFMYKLFIGDTIASQLASVFENNLTIISKSSIDLIPLSDIRDYLNGISLSKVSHIYYCIGFSDVVNLKESLFEGFYERVQLDLNQLTRYGIPITLVIPVFPEYDLPWEFNMDMARKVQSVEALLEQLGSEFELNVLDLRDYLDSSDVNKDGIIEKGMNNIKDNLLE